MTLSPAQLLSKQDLFICDLLTELRAIDRIAMNTSPVNAGYCEITGRIRDLILEMRNA